MTIRVLVTGASGLLGSSLLPYLKHHGYDVLGIGLTGKSDICGDLTNYHWTFNILNKFAPDIIINLAALTNIEECESNPNLAYLKNVLIIENLAEAIIKAGLPCHIIQISTDHVYDGEGPHKEDTVTLLNTYAFSKYAAELALKHVPATILRTNFFGRSHISTRLSLSDWIVMSLSQGVPIRVFSDVFFSPLSIQSLIKYISCVLDIKPVGTFNLGSSLGMSKADFAYKIAKMFNFSDSLITKCSISDIKQLARRPNDMRMCNELFQKVCALRLPTLEEEIHSIKKYY